jgi:hypothetical protein
MTAAIRGALHDAKIDGDVVIGGCFADAIEIAVLDRYTLINIVCIQ